MHKGGLKPHSVHFYIVLGVHISKYITPHINLRALKYVYISQETEGFVIITNLLGRGPRVVGNTAAFHARVRGSVPGLGGLNEKTVSSPSTCESQYCWKPP